MISKPPIHLKQGLVFCLAIFMAVPNLFSAAPDLMKSPTGGYVKVIPVEEAREKIGQENAAAAQGPQAGLTAAYTESPISPAENAGAGNTVAAISREPLTESEQAHVIELADRLERNIQFQQAVVFLSESGRDSSLVISKDTILNFPGAGDKTVGEYFKEILEELREAHVPDAGGPDFGKDADLLVDSVINAALEARKSYQDGPHPQQPDGIQGDSSREETGAGDFVSRLALRQQRFFQIAVLMAVRSIQNARERGEETYNRALTKVREPGIHEEIRSLDRLRKEDGKVFGGDHAGNKLKVFEDGESLLLGKELAAIISLLTPPKDVHPFLRVMFYGSNPNVSQAYEEVRAELRQLAEKSQPGQASVRSSRYEEAKIRVLKKLLAKLVSYANDWTNDHPVQRAKEIPKLLPQP